LNEIFRRVEPKGRTIGEYLRAEISGPLGIDVYIGVEEDELKRFSSLQTWHWSKVMAQSMIPEMFGRKIEPNMATIVLKAFKVVSTSRELERTQPTRQPVVEGMEKIKNPANIFPNFNTKEVSGGLDTGGFFYSGSTDSNNPISPSRFEWGKYLAPMGVAPPEVWPS
jgi:hypothetical protein